MNSKQSILVIMIISSLGAALIAKQGCLAKSYGLKQKFDPKEYHPVSCNCPCDAWAARGLKSARRSECLECGHAHNPGPNPYVPASSKLSFNTSNQGTKTKQDRLTQLIKLYQGRTRKK